MSVEHVNQEVETDVQEQESGNLFEQTNAEAAKKFDAIQDDEDDNENESVSTEENEDAKDVGDENPTDDISDTEESLDTDSQDKQSEEAKDQSAGEQTKESDQQDPTDNKGDDTNPSDNNQQSEQPSADSPDEDEELDLDSILDPDWVDESVREGVKAVYNKLQERNKTLQEKLAKTDEYIAAQQQREYVETFDRQISSLEGFEDVFESSKKGYELDKDSDAFKNRVKLDEQIQVLASGYKSSGKPLPSQQDLFNMALNSLFADKKVSEPAGKKSSKRPNLTRPSKSTQRKKTADEISLEKADAFVKKAHSE